ncbi:serine/threonine-protein kinase [Streptomyces afghaniensis]|uniref:serine/threonine-protein kinase n=1 Tax=Streptomyces afghaniensis TaxID=66865 RepID=UPI0037D49454
MALRDSDPAEVGGYRIEDRLGSGGMGVVYLARSASGRPLAIKVVHGQYADDDEFRARFRREVAAARQVSGAFTAPVVDADADAPRPWMATLYIPGADLGTHVREHGPLPLPRLRELAAGLAEALRDMHRAGVVHRDLKPANVMLADDGPRVIDFGISRAAEFAASDVLTQTGRVMGTPPFMSPEQFASPQDVGPAADIFSLGSVLTHAATRRGPFDSPSPYETALRVVEGEPELSGVPDELLPVIRRCLEKHHKSRPTADQLLTLLRDGSAPAAHLLPTTGSSQARPTEPAGTVWPDAAPAEQDEEQPHRGDEGQQPHRSGRARTERHERPRDTAGTPTPTPTPEAPRPGSRRRRRLLLLSAALTAVLAAVVTTTVVRARGGDPAPSATAKPADLPAGWKPWTAQAETPSWAGRAPGRDSSFQRCTSVGPSLVCAGAQIMATRFDLAAGHNTWSRFVDPTAPDGSSFDEGAIIGTDRGRVYAYEADERQMADGAGPLFTYTVAALAADTGKVLWRTRTALGQTASVPDGEHGGATAVPEGVITLYGEQGDQYALLDADTGEVRWKRPKPQVADDCRMRAATERAYLICTTGRWHKGTARTSVSQLSAATGKPSWTVEAKGALDVLGQDGDHLVLADTVSPGGGLTLVDVSSRALTAVRVPAEQSDAAGAYLVRGTVYLTRTSGGVSAISPRTGRTLWDSNSTVERPGPPAASATHVYVASPSGRVAALNAATGKVEGTRSGRDDSGPADNTSGAPLTLVGDALYVPYGERSVYTLDVRDL